MRMQRNAQCRERVKYIARQDSQENETMYLLFNGCSEINNMKIYKCDVCLPFYSFCDLRFN